MSVTKSWVALVCGIVLVLPVAAQEDTVPKEPPPAETKETNSETAPTKKGIDDPPLHRWGGFTVSVAGWSPSLVGADEEVATASTANGGQPLLQGSSESIRETVRVTYHLPHDFGSIVVQYEGMEQDDFLQNFTPGQFNFAETRAYPYAIGAFDDGLADGVSSSATRKTREFRLEYQNRAFDSKWARGTWGVGYRELSHARGLGITYYAIVPNLPPIIPPIVPENTNPLGLQPLSDTVSQTSGFSGHGLGASLDVEFVLHPRVSIISGLSIGLIRGKAESVYTSTSSYYYGLGGRILDIVDYLSTATPAQIDAVDQQSVTVGLSTASNSQFAQSYDVYVGLQVIAYKGLRVFGTLRDVSYMNVGEYVVPTYPLSNTRTSLNAGYEGYTVGLSWRF